MDSPTQTKPDESEGSFLVDRREVLLSSRALGAAPARAVSTVTIKLRVNRLEHVYISTDPSRREDIAALVRTSGRSTLIAEGGTPDKLNGNGTSNYAFGAQFAEVRVHALTGEVRLARMLGAFACGRILNTKTAKSQLIGGMIFGLGQALMEKTVTDTRNGRIMTKDLAEYQVPTRRNLHHRCGGRDRKRLVQRDWHSRVYPTAYP